MTAIQQTEGATFGAARLFATDSTGQKFPYADLKSVKIELKSELKSYWAEGTFAAGVANGHTEIDITAEYYKMTLRAMAQAFGVSAPTSSTYATIEDEAGIIPATGPYIVTLAQAPLMRANSETVYVVHVASNGQPYKVFYTRVASTPVAGVSYTIAAGVLTFAAGDTGLVTQISYDYTNAAGQQITLTNVAQNSGNTFQMQCVKKETSIVDGSTRLFIANFNAVKCGGFSIPAQEGDWNVYQQPIKAFSDSSGTVATFQMINI